MRVAIVENTRVTHHGQVGVALHESGARIDLFKPWAGQPVPDGLSHDAIVVFGGEQAATDDHTHPYLPVLAQTLRQAAESGRAVLGICLGGQLLARAFGARNLLGGAREFGWCDVTQTDEAAADPVMAALPRTFPIFQWHSDTFTLPEGATLLASSPVATHQAFRIGRACYGTQFHFEASRAVVADWSREFPEVMAQMHPEWPKAHAEHAPVQGAAADVHGLTLARAWVRMI